MLYLLRTPFSLSAGFGVRDLVSKGEGAAEALRFAVSILILWQLRVHSIRVVATPPTTVR